jgi:hypothetical protein
MSGFSTVDFRGRAFSYTSAVVQGFLVQVVTGGDSCSPITHEGRSILIRHPH